MRVHGPLTVRGFVGLTLACGLGYALEAAERERHGRYEESPEGRLERVEALVEGLIFEMDELRHQLLMEVSAEEEL